MTSTSTPYNWSQYSLPAKWRVLIASVTAVFLFFVLRPSPDPHPLRADRFSLGNYSSHFANKASSSLPKWPWSTKTEDESFYDPSLIHPGAKADTAEYVALCLAVKDQSEDLKEFLRHHYYHLGIRRFYIMDDRSSPALSNTEDYTIPRSALTFRYFTPASRPGSATQGNLYNECHARFGQRHTWLGFIDADEYLELPSSPPGTSLASFLTTLTSTYPTAGALAVQWQIHTSNNQLTRQNSTRQAYTACIYDGPNPQGQRSDNLHVKSFVQTADYADPASVHHFNLKHGKVTVGEHGDVVDGYLRSPPTRDRVVLHHYTVKSREEWEEKMARGNAQDNPRGWEWWDKYENSEKVECGSLAAYYP